MLFTRFAIVVGAIGCMVSTDSASIVECPPMHHREPLKSVRVFDGPRSMMVNLIPNDGGWPLGYPPWSKQGFRLVCLYGEHEEPVEIRLPDDVKSCRFGSDYPRTICDSSPMASRR